MTAQAGDAPAPAQWFAPRLATSVTLAELGAVAAVAAVAIVSSVSLALALAGLHDLPAVAAISAALFAVGALAAWRDPRRPEVRIDRAELIVLPALVVVAAMMFLPGFRYAAGDKDPGVYVTHAIAIAREGAATLDDPVLEAEAEGAVSVQYHSPGARFPGIWVSPDDPTQVRPQFYHLYPALAATMHDLVGTRGVFHLNPALATGVVIAAALAARRAFGDLAAVVVGVLLSTNMLQVWQAKYTSSEVLTELMVVGALLGACLAICARWRAAAAVAGFAAGVTFMARADGVLVVMMAMGTLAALAALRRFDDRAVAFGAGLGVALPLALLQAYGVNRSYTDTVTVPSLTALGLLTVALCGAAIAWRTLLAPRLRAAAPRVERVGKDSLMRLVGIAVTAAFAAILVLAWNRASLLGEDTLVRNLEEIRSYDEQNLHRLAMFLTVPGVVLMAVGVGVVSIRRWRATSWVTVLAGLLLLPVYLWAARISPQMMWWGRRFVPVVLPAVLLLISVGVAFLLEQRRGHGTAVQAVGLATLAYMVVTFASQSVPLRTHNEFGGSLDFTRAVAAVAEDRPATFLWQFPGGSIFDPARTFAGPLWLVEDQLSAYLPKEGDPDAYIDRYADAFPDRELYVVTRVEPPADLDLSRLEQVGELQQEMPLWVESNTSRPDRTVAEAGHPLVMEVRIWRLEQR